MKRAWPVAAIALAALAYLWPAYVNGFPLVYWDTGGYLISAFNDAYEPNRSYFYGEFVEDTAFVSAWGTVIAQALIAAWTVLVTCRGLGAGRGATVMVLGLAAATTLAWKASNLMPDLFTALTALSTIALTLGRHGRWTRAGLALLLVFSIAVHTSHLPLAAGTYAAIALARLALNFRYGWRLPLACIGGAVALTVLANALLTGHAFFNRTGWVLLFARFAEGGLVQKALEARCAGDIAWSKFCPIREYIPRNAEEWLWGGNTLFWKIGDWDATKEDSRKVVLEAMRMAPLASATYALNGFGWQLMKIELGEGTGSQVYFLRWTIEKAFPDELNEWLAAGQQHGKLGAVARRANPVHVVLMIGGLVLTLGGVLTRALDPAARAAGIAVLAALCANAFVCGAFSGPHDRYQARLIWIVLVTAMPAAVHALRRAGLAAAPELITEAAAAVNTTPGTGSPAGR